MQQKCNNVAEMANNQHMPVAASKMQRKCNNVAKLAINQHMPVAAPKMQQKCKTVVENAKMKCKKMTQNDLPTQLRTSLACQDRPPRSGQSQNMHKIDQANARVFPRQQPLAHAPCTRPWSQCSLTQIKLEGSLMGGTFFVPAWCPHWHSRLCGKLANT